MENSGPTSSTPGLRRQDAGRLHALRCQHFHYARRAKEFGTRAEIKNLNSFKALERAIEYEVQRQKEILEDGGHVVQETRTWMMPRA